MRRLHHSFMLFGGCPCSRCVAYRQCFCCVEQSETMFEHVVFRCQFLPVLVKRRPCCPGTILDFGRFLLLECNQLALESHAFTSCQDFDFNIIDLHFFFRVRAKAALVAENFRLSWLRYIANEASPETHSTRAEHGSTIHPKVVNSNSSFAKRLQHAMAGSHFKKDWQATHESLENLNRAV